MKLRPYKIGMLAGPALLIGGLIILVTYYWAMNGILWSYVRFEGAAASLSVSDKQNIRTLVLTQKEIATPPHSMARFKVVINNQRHEGQLTGTVTSNTLYAPDAVIELEKQAGTWQILFWGNAR